jgi:hypothetical protein
MKKWNSSYVYIYINSSSIHAWANNKSLFRGYEHVKYLLSILGCWRKWRYFPNPLAPLHGSSLPYWSTGLITQFLYFSQAVGLLGRVVSSTQGLYLNTRQHKHRKCGHMLDIHAQGRIGTRNYSLRAIEDCSCLRRLGYRDRRKGSYNVQKYRLEVVKERVIQEA